MLPIRPPAGHRQFQHARGGRRRCGPYCRMMICEQKMQWVQLVWSGSPAGILGASWASCRQSSKAARHRRHLQEGKKKSPSDDQQALRGDRIGDDDAHQRPQEPLALDARSEYAAHAKGTIDPAVAAFHQLTTEHTLHNAIDAKCPSGGAINAWCGSKRQSQRHKTSGRRRRGLAPERGWQRRLLCRRQRSRSR